MKDTYGTLPLIPAFFTHPDFPGTPRLCVVGTKSCSFDPVPW